MESLSETPWDAVISGTGLQQSLLALSLSRCDKKVLHVDHNAFYGGGDAAFSLQEADDWVKCVNEDSSSSTSTFADASSWKLDAAEGNSLKLAHSRSYSLSLSPQIIYARSKLLEYLVSSKVYRQLEFQAVGSWWLYTPGADDPRQSDLDSAKLGRLQRIPNGREDVFTDENIDLRAKRSLMKFLKFVVDYENQVEVWESEAETPLPDFLSLKFRLPAQLQTVMVALTLTLDLPENVKVGYALPRIARHLTSIGVFGPGFGAVVPKWGGSSEIAQVACRAMAVGGGVYVLGTGIKNASSGEKLQVTLSNEEVVQTTVVVDSNVERDPARSVSKSISIVQSSLDTLFTTTVEGAPTSAVAVVVFPSNTLVVDGSLRAHPVYVIIHSSETGECPAGQSVMYASTLDTPDARNALKAAVETIFKSAIPDSDTEVLYSVSFKQYQTVAKASTFDGVYSIPPSGLDLAFDDSLLRHVEDLWKIIGSPREEDVFMKFSDREGVYGDDDE